MCHYKYIEIVQSMRWIIHHEFPFSSYLLSTCTFVIKCLKDFFLIVFFFNFVSVHAFPSKTYKLLIENYKFFFPQMIYTMIIVFFYKQSRNEHPLTMIHTCYTQDTHTVSHVNIVTVMFICHQLYE